MIREIPPCPGIPGVYYRLRGEDQVYRAPITANIASIVEFLMAILIMLVIGDNGND